MNNSSSFGWKQIMQILGLVLVGATSFFGYTYFWEGSYVVSGAMVLALMVIIYILVDRLVVFQKAVRKQWRNTNELIVFSLYAVIAFVLSVGVFHSVSVDLVEKKQIQEKGVKKLNLLLEMRKNYNAHINEVSERYRIELETCAKEFRNGNKDRFKRAGLIEGVDPASQINEKVEALKTSLQATENDKETDATRAEAKDALDKWKRISLIPVFEKIENQFNKNLKSYKGRISERKRVESIIIVEDFNFKEFGEKIDITHPGEFVNLKKAGFWKAVFAAILGQILILVPYIFGDRGERRKYTPPGKIRGIEI